MTIHALLRSRRIIGLSSLELASLFRTLIGLVLISSLLSPTLTLAAPVRGNLPVKVKRASAEKKTWKPGNSPAANRPAPLAERGSRGTDFWLAAPGSFGGPQELSLVIASEVDTTGEVEVRGANFSKPFSVAAGKTVAVELPSSAVTQGSDVVGRGAIHVTAIDRVSLYGFNYIDKASGAYLGLPAETLGTEYIVIGSEPIAPKETAFTVVATANDTTATITPSAGTEQRAAGVAYTVKLNQGETYRLRTAMGGDLTGSTVTSDKPVAVFIDYRCDEGPKGSCGGSSSCPQRSYGAIAL
jgi:hypothetical protein